MSSFNKIIESLMSSIHRAAAGQSLRMGKINKLFLPMGATLSVRIFIVSSKGEQKFASEADKVREV